MSDVYDMTWAEFQIRLFAYNRMQKNEWFKIREIAWASLVGSHQDPKKLPKSKEAFMPLNGNKPKQGVSEAQKEAFRKAMQEYLMKTNDAKN